jgi:S1-C subfamily serine protease/pSer/pThr/pTyr-binding forkhead associated (FHA) protein
MARDSLFRRLAGYPAREYAKTLMPIELRILTGARSGQSDYFEKNVISIGRHPSSDFLLDVKRDLDVSRRHGEIRFIGNGYRVYDKDSTNGTFVNDIQLEPGGNQDIEDGDTIRFGAQGPTVSVVISGVARRTTPLSNASMTPAEPADAVPASPLGVGDGRPHVSSLAAKLHERMNTAERRAEARSLAAAPFVDREPMAAGPVDEETLKGVVDAGRNPYADESTPPSDPQVDITAEPHVPDEVAERLPTVERVAVEVKKQTRTLRYIIVAVVAVLGGVAGGMYFYGHGETASRDAEIQRLLAANEQSTRQFQTKLQSMDDTAVTNALQRRLDSLVANATIARDPSSKAAAEQQLRENQELQQRINAMDVPAVRDANDPAIALILSEINGKQFEATGFTVTSTGLLVTNRHVVTDSAGTAPTKLLVKFANTKEWKPAHLVRVADNQNVDLALLQMNDSGQYRAVSGIATTMDARVGAPIATIGFPMGTDSPMQGAGSEFTAKTSLTIGRVSKTVPELLQIDAFASHGSSGSPVVDEHGHVIGVVWGGPKGAGGRIVFAVPADQVAALIGSVK